MYCHKSKDYEVTYISKLRGRPLMIWGGGRRKNRKWIYSRVSLMWTPKGRAKSVHISEPSTVVDTLCCGHIGKINGPGKKCPLRRSVHIGGVSTRGNCTVFFLRECLLRIIFSWRRPLKIYFFLEEAF